MTPSGIPENTITICSYQYFISIRDAILSHFALRSGGLGRCLGQSCSGGLAGGLRELRRGSSRRSGGRRFCAAPGLGLSAGWRGGRAFLQLARLKLETDLALGRPGQVGLERSTFPTADSGYAYLITNAGVGGAALAWCLFAFMTTPNGTAARVRGFIALFAALSLCVSGNSLFSIKTAGLLWFLYGAAQNADHQRGT